MLGFRLVSLMMRALINQYNNFHMSKDTCGSGYKLAELCDSSYWNSTISPPYGSLHHLILKSFQKRFWIFTYKKYLYLSLNMIVTYCNIRRTLKVLQNHSKTYRCEVWHHYTVMCKRQHCLLLMCAALSVYFIKNVVFMNILLSMNLWG